MKVLIVDKDSGFTTHLAQRLRGQGFEVLVAEQGEQVLDLACLEDVRAVLLGIFTRKEHRFDLLRKIREACPNSKVILINHSGDVPLSIEAMKLGAVDEVQTPVNVDELSTKLRTIGENGTR